MTAAELIARYGDVMAKVPKPLRPDAHAGDATDRPPPDDEAARRFPPSSPPRSQPSGDDKAPEAVDDRPPIPIDKVRTPPPPRGRNRAGELGELIEPPSKTVH
jgi:hypothetical protein